MIFDLEDDASDRASLDTGSSPLYQLQEHVQAPERPARKRTNQSSLSQSFSNLRPTSLPVPSNMRTPVPQAEIDSIPQLLRPAPGASSLHNRPTRRRSMEHLTDKEDEYDDREAAIRQLVAADIPSHRGAWKKNSKAWKTFSRRQDGKPNSRYGGLIPEETEDGADMDENDIIGLPSDESDEDDSDGEGTVILILHAALFSLFTFRCAVGPVQIPGLSIIITDCNWSAREDKRGAQPRIIPAEDVALRSSRNARPAFTTLVFGEQSGLLCRTAQGGLR